MRQQTARQSLDQPNQASTDTKLDTSSKPPTQRRSLPLPPPNASDLKWPEHHRQHSGRVSDPKPASQSKETPKTPGLPANIIPELSHLAVGKASTRPPQRSPDNHRPPSYPASTNLTMRRLHAKTPVFAIGQLEAGALPSRGSFALASDSKRSSAEILAEQYRALLASRNSIFTDSQSEPPPSPRDNIRSAEEKRHSTDAYGGMGRLRRFSSEMPSDSSTSDDGTLVSFDDTIYFKPVSLSPEPGSPLLHFQSPTGGPSPVPDNLSLQICMDLLTRDLSSAISGRRARASPDAAALQIWVMIEAYERLRDQLLDMRLPYEDSRPLGQMFDMWLRTLYSIHDSLRDEATQSESDG